MARRKRLTKKQSERYHSQRRLQERYGIDCYNDLRSRIIKEIKNSQTVIVEKQSLRTSHRLAKIDGEIFSFIWDKNRKEIVTFLPIKESDRSQLEFFFKFGEQLNNIMPPPIDEKTKLKEDLKKNLKNTKDKTFDSFQEFMGVLEATNIQDR